MVIGNALSVGLIGLKAFTVSIQAFVSPGLPYFSIIGLPDASLSEARERVKSACQATGFRWPENHTAMLLAIAMGAVVVLGVVNILGEEYAVLLVTDDQEPRVSGVSGDAARRPEPSMGTLLASIGLLG